MTLTCLTQFLFSGIFLLFSSGVLGQQAARSALLPLIPAVKGWTLAESPRAFLPGTLFEYIDGAAENYLSYAFQELIVANLKTEQSSAALTLEIYDMANDRNAFGIYSSERYPESRFLNIGNEGYWEEGTLNFIAGRYYVKLLCFECGDGALRTLTSLAAEIEKRIKEKGQLPPLLGLFPKEGLVAHSEKFILQNVLGFGFLHDGYLAGYQARGSEFEVFILEGRDEPDAADMLKQYLESHLQHNQIPEKNVLGFHIKDRYAENIYIVAAERLVLGVMRIKDGSEDLGWKYLQALKTAAGQ
jgi:hypothetical protein